MRVLKTFRPGQHGTKRFEDRFGTSLVCVRHRWDELTDARVTTVELIVEATRPKRPPARLDLDDAPPEHESVRVRIDYRETALRQQAKQAGARWCPDARLWELPRRAAVRLGLEDRIVPPVPADRGASGTDRHAECLDLPE